MIPPSTGRSGSETGSGSETIARVIDTVDYLQITVGPGGDRDWSSCAELVDNPPRLLELAQSTKSGRGIEDDDVAVSLLVQGYAFRVASAAIGGWLLDHVVLDVGAGNTAIALGQHGPNALHLATDRLVKGRDSLACLHERLIEAHLAPLVSSAHAACRVGEKLLWGNIGASCAASLGAFMGPLDHRRQEIAERAEAFFASARPEIVASGSLVRMGERWMWERNACCLWYRVESGFKCEDCSLWSSDDKAARRERLLIEAES